MRKSFLTIVTLLLCLSAFAQKKVAWILDVEGNEKQIFVHAFTGVSVLETSKFYYGINPDTQSFIWRLEKNATNEGAKKVNNIANMAGAGGQFNSLVSESWQPIPLSPFVSVDKKTIDITTGKVILGEGEDEYSKITQTYFIAEAYVYLVETLTADKQKKLYCIDMNDKSVRWKTVVGSMTGAGKLLKMAGATSSLDVSLSPKVTNSGDFIYRGGKTLFLLKGNSGEIVWQNEVNPGAFFLDNKQEYLVVVDAPSAFGQPKYGEVKLGKKIQALDIKNGQPLWKKPVKLDDSYISSMNVSDSEFLVNSGNSINIYEYKSGQSIWKKGYKAGNVKEVKLLGDNLEVFYGNKQMLIAKSDASEQWKKPIKFDMDEDIEGGVIKKEYEKGILMIHSRGLGFYDKTSGKKIWNFKANTDKVSFDDQSTMVAVLDKKKLYLFNPNLVEKKPEKSKFDIEEPKDIFFFETTEKGYFIVGPQEFLCLDKKGTLVSQKYYKQLEADRLAKAALMAGKIAGDLSTSVQIGSTNSNGETEFAAPFMSPETTRNVEAVSDLQREQLAKIRNQNKLHGKAQVIGNHAFFMEGVKTEAGDQLTMIKVDKNTGEELERFEVGSDRKVVYKIIESQNILYAVVGGKLTAYYLN
ncbi:outer membrane protein assembly factor BamB family protein [Flammeovirga agarivorans]|uniref:PQQ-binding-like beta-propeller repeat protein n=1 Tax=Flammeovirga agarivorans TaxID=2726742 RepID=A0A7X8XTM9_9BACT|nr:PQQ-binding-like beta-propeller repeat protein [Flammeovirga agarivorans]NLR89582.1 PQQ-binding-like beta-propeller repeat protein [Flammeovirga agarivorans]